VTIKKCQPKELTPYLDGELAAETREQVEEHLRSCAACGALLDEATSARERVRGMGRSLIPATTLMPALEHFRERAGIGAVRRLDQAGIPEPLGEAPEVAEDAALDGAVPLDGPEIYDDPRFHAVLAGAPLDGVGLMAPARAPAPAVGKEVADLAEEPGEAPETVTWVAMDPPIDATDDDTVVSHGPYVPEPPALEGVVEPPVSATGEVASEPVRVFEPPPIPEPPPVPERFVHQERPGGPGLFSAIARPATPEAHPDVPPEVENVGPLPWEQEAPEEAPSTALEDRPDAPEPLPVPPWAEAEVADAEDIEARGRRLVAEDLATQVTMEREVGEEWHTVPSGPEQQAHLPSVLAPDVADPEPGAESPQEPADEVAAAVARMREELAGPPAPPTAEPAIAVPALGKQVKIGLAAAAAIALIAVAGVMVLPRLGSHPASTIAANPVASPAGHTTPAATASPQAVAAGTPAPSTVRSVPPLSGVVRAGAAGAGYRVLRIRTGNPAAGVYRIVLDLEGSGAAPDAQLGRGSDGSLYLQATGINIDPAPVAAFKPLGPISGLSATGAPTGLSLKFASALAQSPQYSLYYLTGPNRLVIDLK
jgi:hypothetical protein